MFGSKRSQIHDEICRGLLHSAVYGNYTTLTRLLSICNSEAIRKKIIKWIELFSPFEVQATTPFKFTKLDQGDFDIDGAFSTPYWTIIYPKLHKGIVQPPPLENILLNSSQFLPS